MGCSEAIDALTAIAVLHTIITLVLAGVVIVVLFRPRLVYVWREIRGKPHSKDDTDYGTEYSSYTSSNRLQLTRKPKTPEAEAAPETTLSFTPGFEVKSNENVIHNPNAVQVEFVAVDRGESVSAPSSRRASMDLLASGSTVDQVRKRSRISVASIASSLGGFSKQFVPGSRKSQDFDDLELMSGLIGKEDSSSTSEGPDSPVKKDLSRGVELPGSHTEESQA